MKEEDQTLEGRLHLRYEDIAQDGRLMLGALPVALGVLWRGVTIPAATSERMREDGVLPILTRLSLEGGGGPFAVHQPLDVTGGYRLLRAEDAEGDVARILLDMHGTLTGKKGRTNLPQPDDAGSPVLAGKLDVEHVFTKPFAPPGERKVLALDDGGRRFVPTARREWLPPQSVVEPPVGGNALDPDYVEDPIPIAMGLMHSDSNQHVNSLVYPRLFEEASLRRLARLGRSTTVLARSLTVGYRRPSFVGETLRVFVRTFEEAGAIVTTGLLFGSDDDVRARDRARVFVRLRFG